MSHEAKRPSEDATETLAALKRAVKNTLERKQRLGQYAVVWRDGKPAIQDDTADDHALFSQELQPVATRPSSVAENKGEYRSDNE